MESCEAYTADFNCFGCTVWEEPAHPTVLPHALWESPGAQDTNTSVTLTSP